MNNKVKYLDKIFIFLLKLLIKYISHFDHAQFQWITISFPRKKKNEKWCSPVMFHHNRTWNEKSIPWMNLCKNYRWITNSDDRIGEWQVGQSPIGSNVSLVTFAKSSLQNSHLNHALYRIPFILLSLYVFTRRWIF